MEADDGCGFRFFCKYVYFLFSFFRLAICVWLSKVLFFVADLVCREFGRAKVSDDCWDVSYYLSLCEGEV